MSKLKTFYTVPELARMAGIDPRTMRKLLAERGIQFVGESRKKMVALSEIEAKFPDFFRSQAIKGFYEKIIGGNGPVQ